MLTRFGIFTATLLSLVLMAGCGQKGPLYLPGNPTKVKTDVPPQNQTGTSEQEDDEDPDEEREEDSPPLEPAA